MIHIAIMGHGVVGSGVAEVLLKNKESIDRKAGDAINLKYILDLRDFPDTPYHDRFVKTFAPIVDDDEVSIVVETMGGLNPAYEYVKACLQKGKSVVTSNKELVAAKGAELLRLAAEQNSNFLFEASVGGGIPIIRPLHQCLGANEIYEIAGILNGTTNFILTKMIREGSDFTSALKEAQALGYAERDPTADVEGHDSCRKICILASLAFGSHLYPEKVPTEGITALTAEDVAYAGSWGGVIKLIARAKKQEDGKVYAMVSPAFVSRESQLASVDDVFNGILVRGDATGDVVFYGKGAGKLPTASAVVADIIDAVKAGGTIATLQWKESMVSPICDMTAAPVAAYVRLQGTQTVEASRVATEVFGGARQLERPGSPEGEFAFITGVLTEAALVEKLAALEGKGLKVLQRIRIVDC